MSFFEIMCKMTGYEPKSTFWDDFNIAEAYGSTAIRDTYNRIMNGWSDNYIYLTELVIVLNWNIWYWNDCRSNQAKEFEDLYCELFEKTDIYCLDHLNGKELQYFLRTVD